MRVLFAGKFSTIGTKLGSAGLMISTLAAFSSVLITS